ncbi:MAG: helix-turn-helix domain-containing protein [Halonotius sp.]
MTMSEQTDDETPDSTATDGEAAGLTGEGPRAELEKTKERLEAEADRAVSEFDEGIVDLLAWLLDTETRARIYVYLRQHPHSTSDEIAEGTGLYPSTVREALADLHDEDTVLREKRDSDSAGNNPYEYEAIAPSNLVRGVVGEVQRELNTVFNLEGALGDGEGDDGPVTITVDGDDEPDDDTASDAEDSDDAVDIEIDDAESEDDA